jgi:hypothetical protein
MSSIALFSQHQKQNLEIGQHVASRLEFRMVSMQTLIELTAEHYHIPPAELAGVFRTKSLWRGAFSKKQTKLAACIDQQLCRMIADDRVVFVGHAGHPIFQEISHVLKVLVLAHPSPRSAPPDPAIKKWFSAAYQRDLEDPGLYDLTVNLAHMDVAEAGNIIINTVQNHKFAPMTYSLKCMGNLELSSQIKTLLVDDYPDVMVRSHDGAVYIYSSGFKRGKQKAALDAKHTLLGLEGVSHVEVYGDKKLFDINACGQIR